MADCIVQWLGVKIVTCGKYTKICIQHCYLQSILFGSEDDQLPKQLPQKYLHIHYCFYITETHLISDSLVHVLMARCPSFVSFLSCVEYLSLQKRPVYYEDNFFNVIVQYGTFFHLEHLLCWTLENMAACKTRYNNGILDVLPEVKLCFANFRDPFSVSF